MSNKPIKTPQVTVRFSKAQLYLLDKLDKDSRAIGASKSVYIRMLIAQGLK